MKGHGWLLHAILSIYILTMSSPTWALPRTTNPVSQDWSLTASFSTDKAIRAGDTVSINYTYAYLKPESSRYESFIFAYLPQEMHFQQYNGPAKTNCRIISNNVDSTNSTYLAGYSAIYCYPINQSIVINQQNPLNFSIIVSVSQNLTAQKTKVYAYPGYSLTPEQWTDADNHVNLFEKYSAPYLSMLTYTYNSPGEPSTTNKPNHSASNTTTQSTISSHGSSSANIQGQESTVQSGNNLIEGTSAYGQQKDSEGNLQGIQPSETPNTPLKKVQLKTIEKKPNSTWTDIIAQHKIQFLSGTITFIIIVILSIYLARKIRAKHQQQRQYKHALTLLKNVRTQPSNNEEPNRESITRTFVEMEKDTEKKLFAELTLHENN